jgi:hypothetical protein
MPPVRADRKPVPRSCQVCSLSGLALEHLEQLRIRRRPVLAPVLADRNNPRRDRQALQLPGPRGGGPSRRDRDPARLEHRGRARPAYKEPRRVCQQPAETCAQHLQLPRHSRKVAAPSRILARGSSTWRWRLEHLAPAARAPPIGSSSQPVPIAAGVADPSALAAVSAARPRARAGWPVVARRRALMRFPATGLSEQGRGARRAPRDTNADTGPHVR